MNSDTSLPETRRAVGELLDIADITEVICVDDMYGSMPIDAVLEACARMPDEAWSRLPHVGQFVSIEDKETRRDAVREHWNELSGVNQKSVSDAIRHERDAANFALDQLSVPALDAIMAGRHLSKLTLADWRAKKSSLKGSSSPRTLVLFDQDMRYGGGVEDQGIQEVEAIVRGSDYPNIVAGVVTHGKTIDEELGEWQRLSTEHNLGPDRWLLTSKQRLSEDPPGFALMMKLTLLSGPCRTMKDRVMKSIRSSLDSASEKLDRLSVYDFEHVALRCPYSEGTWEPDMLVRLFGIYQRKHALPAMKADTGLDVALAKARLLSAVVTMPQTPPQQSSANIQRAEMYEEQDIVNTLHLPIELGDIFERTTSSGNNRYILLANACNLMVRANGQRSGPVKEAILATIRTVGSTELKSAPARYAELLYLDLTEAKRWFVDFKLVHSVRLDVLDMCVFSDEGWASLSATSRCPEGVIPPWAKRHEKLRIAIERVVSKCTVNSSDICVPDLQTALELSSSNFGLLQPTIDKATMTLTYNVRRTGRLCRARAEAMLAACASYHARPAFEQDIGSGDS